MLCYKYSPLFLIGVVCVLVACVYRDRFFYLQRKCIFNVNDNKERLKDLKTNLTLEIFGQHVAINIVLRALYSHYTDESPHKALVLSFHGSLGSGKTAMSQLIANVFYDGGFGSPFVHAFIGPRHFIGDPSKLRENQENLRMTIEKSVETCSRALFVFDEVDKMPPEIFDVIIPFIDHHTSIDGVDYRGLTFIFLSNTGAGLINELVFRHKRLNKARESITYDDFRQLILHDAFTEKGGLHKAQMIEKRLIDYFVPFLPLEREHVVQCARRDILKRRVLFVQPEAVADKVIYVPQAMKIFSEDGCKSVTNNVNFFVREVDHIFNEEL